MGINRFITIIIGNHRIIIIDVGRRGVLGVHHLRGVQQVADGPQGELEPSEAERGLAIRETHFGKEVCPHIIAMGVG